MTDSNLEHRLSRLEATVESFVDAVSKQFEHMNEQHSSMYTHLDGLRDAINNSQRTPWANLIAAGALVVTIVALGAQRYIQDLDRVQYYGNKRDNLIYDHIADGHPEHNIDVFNTHLHYLQKQLNELKGYTCDAG